MTRTRLISVIGPGMLVAATGVGAGDLATGAFTGSQLGLAILWAVLVGAVFKFALNEGLTRWQLATGTTLLEGCYRHFGVYFQWFFLGYLLIWSLLLGAALMSACGVVMHAMLPVCATAAQDKVLWGIVQSVIAVGLVLWGGYRFFERVMSICIGIMFFTVVITAGLTQPDLSELFSGLFWPSIPYQNGAGLEWTIALLGGVGGTLTILCYGYWIREEGRVSVEDLKICRWDLASGYAMTALFGIAMVMIGARTDLTAQSSARTIVLLAEQLKELFGSYGLCAYWMFLVGAWGAVFSSLLGVWQSVPYLFADVWESLRAYYQSRKRKAMRTDSWPYRSYLLILAFLPMPLLIYDFKTLQKISAITGATVIPLLAMILLTLGSQRKLIGYPYRNPWWSTLILAAALLFSVYASVLTISRQFS